MNHNVLYVTPEATVRTAVELLRSHQAEIVPVVDSGRIVGLLEPLTLSLYDGEVGVAEIMQPDPLTVHPEDAVAMVAHQMRARQVRQAPVVSGSELIGLISDRDVLSVWGNVHDDLTGLPVQYQFRRWVTTNLAAAHEVAILFLDLDNFGEVNKKHGHVVGDRLLTAIASVLRASTSPEQDFLCRYGGDEFAIATTRNATEAYDLAVRIRDQVATVRIDGRKETIGISIGMAGGRRSRPRHDQHAESTLDDLITQASTASTTAKREDERIYAVHGPVITPVQTDAATHPAPMIPRVVLVGYRVGQTSRDAELTVTLRASQRSLERKIKTPQHQINTGLANVSAECLEELADGKIRVEIEETYEYATPRGMACVGATIQLVSPLGTERLIGVVPVRDDLYRAYISAVLDATNRRLDPIRSQLA
jgi:IMP dehydrogenase